MLLWEKPCWLKLTLQSPPSWTLQLGSSWSGLRYLSHGPAPRTVLPWRHRDPVLVGRWSLLLLQCLLFSVTLEYLQEEHISLLATSPYYCNMLVTWLSHACHMTITCLSHDWAWLWHHCITCLSHDYHTLVTWRCHYTTGVDYCVLGYRDPVLQMPVRKHTCFE